MGVTFNSGYSQASFLSKQVKFSGTKPEETEKTATIEKPRSKFLYPALLASFLPLIAPASVSAQDFTPQSGSNGKVIYVDPNLSLDSVNQLKPILNNGTGTAFTQRIIDLKPPHNLLTPEATQRIYQAIEDCKAINAKNGSCAEFFLSVVGESGYRSAEQLATDIGDLIGLGRQSTSGLEFDNIINDGFSITVINDRLVVNGPEKLGFSEGNGMRGLWSRARSRVAATAIPEVKKGAALLNTDPKQAQIHFSNGIEAAVNILIADAKAYKASEMQRARESYVSPEEQASRDAAFKKTATYALSGLFLMIGLLGGGFTYHNWRKRRQEVADQCIGPLEKMGSNYEVTYKNVFSLNTVEALLENSPESANFPSSRAILEPLNLLVNELWPHTNKPQNAFQEKPFEKMSKKEKALVAELGEILVEKGLNHPLAGIRVAAIDTLLTDGLQEDEYKAFVDLLGTEQDYKVIDTLVKPVTDMTTADQVPVFQTKLQTSNQAGTRALSLSILEKFSSEDTLGEFFKALSNENDTGLIKKMQEAVARVSSRYSANNKTEILLADNLKTHQPIKNRSASLKAYASIGSSKHFKGLYQAFLTNEERSLNRDFKAALTQSASASSIPTMYEGLKLGDERIEDMAIYLLGKQPKTEHVDKLLEYLATEDTNYPTEATAVLVSSVGESNRQTLLDIVEGYKVGEEDREPMLAALAGLEKLQVDGGLELMIERFTDIQADDVKKALYDVMERAEHSPENFVKLQETLFHSNKEGLRIVAALVLDDYGSEALKPLFQALSKTSTSSKNMNEVAALEQAIAKAGQDDGSFEIFLDYAKESHPAVKHTATEGALTELREWERRYDYDNEKVMTFLKKLKSHGNHKIEKKAGRIINEFIDDKAQDVRNLGSGSFRRYGDNYQTAEHYADGNYERKIKRAGRDAVSELDSRRRAYEAAERARKAAAERAAAAARASASSSYSSGGYGGGSMGGGGSL